MAGPVPKASAATWWVYVLECDGRLYTGVSTDPARRCDEHRAGGKKAARFARAAKSVEMRYAAAVGTRSIALRAEYRIKQLTRPEKLALLSQNPDAVTLLGRLGLND